MHFNKIFKQNETAQEAKRGLKLFRTKKGALTKQSAILDISCGAGKYGIEFAKSAKEVACSDISSEMIKYAKQNADTAGVKNIVYQLSWPDADIAALGWQKKFDLVFSAYCPGINGAQALKKMLEAGRKHFFVSGFVKRTDKILGNLRKHFGVKEKEWGDRLYYAFNLFVDLGVLS